MTYKENIEQKSSTIKKFRRIQWTVAFLVLLVSGAVAFGAIALPGWLGFGLLGSAVIIVAVTGSIIQFNLETRIMERSRKIKLLLGEFGELAPDGLMRLMDLDSDTREEFLEEVKEIYAKTSILPLVQTSELNLVTVTKILKQSKEEVAEAV